MTLTHLGNTSGYIIKSTPKDEWSPFDFIDTESGWAVIAKKVSPETYAPEGRYIWKKWDQPRSAFSLPPTDGSSYGLGAELTRDGRYLEASGVLFPVAHAFGHSAGQLSNIPPEVIRLPYFGPVDPTRGPNDHPPARTDFDTILLADGSPRKWTRVDMKLDWKYDVGAWNYPLDRAAPGAVAVILDEREYALPGFKPWHKFVSGTYVNKAPTFLREGSTWRLVTTTEATTIEKGMEAWQPAEVEYGLSPRFLAVMAVVDPGPGVDPVPPKTMVGVLDRETGSFKSAEIAGHVRTGAVIRGMEAIFYVDETSPRPGQPFDTGYTRITFRLDTLSYKRGVRKEGTLIYGPATPSYMTDVPQLVEFPDDNGGYRRVLRMDSDEVAVLGEHISISGYTIVLRNYPTISRQIKDPAPSWVELVAWRPETSLGMKDQRSDGYFS